MSTTPPSASAPQPGSGASVGPAGSLADALLPSGVIVHEALDVAARVVLPPEGANGDWFDSVPLQQRQVGLMVGDVVGRGMEALAVMAQLRAALRLALSRDPDPARAIEEVDRYAMTVRGARWARATVAVVDPQRSTASYATAGNPAPIVVRDREDCRPLPSTAGGPIGTGAPAQRASTTLTLDRDDVLLLYTDGLLGRHPQSSIRDVTSVMVDRARAVGGAGGITSAADDVCTRALTALDEVPDDDVVVLAAEVRRVGQLSMAMALPVRMESARAAQLAFLEWSANLGLGEVDELALAQALAEVVGNVVEHARGPAGAADLPTFELRAMLTGPGDVEVTVADRGSWDPSSVMSRREARPGGLAVAARFVDDLQLESGPAGTRVVLHHHVERPVTLSTARNPASGRTQVGRSPDEDFATRLHDGVLEIAGALGHHRAREVGEAVRMAGVGVERLVVDLDQVSLLSTASVRAIDEQRARAGHAPAITLVARPDTVAGQVLALMGVEHVSHR